MSKLPRIRFFVSVLVLVLGSCTSSDVEVATTASPCADFFVVFVLHCVSAVLGDDASDDAAGAAGGLANWGMAGRDAGTGRYGLRGASRSGVGDT